MIWSRIIGLRLVTHDLDRLARFYEAIGFTIGDRGPIDAAEMHLLRVEGTGERLQMHLGPSRVDLDRFEEPGRDYPAGANAADLVFQHLAIGTDDAAAAWVRAAAAGAIPISRKGAVTLPPSSGGVTAMKLRDPDGHPLEFLQFPAGGNPDSKGQGVQGIDHSAMSVADVALSRRYFIEHGLGEGRATLNEGPAQVALDGLADVRVDVVPLNPGATPPHIELLGYRKPCGRSHPPLAANDIAATRIVWAAGRDALLRDPDGHFHQLTR